MSREAMQQALEALEKGETKLRWAAISALKQALAEPEQEPVAWEQFHPDIGNPQTTHWEGCEAVHPECKVTPRKPLTDKQLEAMAKVHVTNCYFDTLTYARAIERAHGIGEQHE